MKIPKTTNTNHPWHSISYGQDAPAIVTGIIEISKGSKAKYEVDKITGLLRLDRVLSSSFHYPINYGFIPKTLCGDGDPLDILVLSQINIEPLCMVTAKVVGVMRMVDNNETDDKIIAIAINDPSVKHIDDISQMPEHFIAELRNFFEEYKKLEHRKVEVLDFLGKEIAQQIILDNIAAYKITIQAQI